MPAGSGDRVRSAIATAIAVASLTLASSPVAGAAFPGANGKIVFSGPEEGIATINPDDYLGSLELAPPVLRITDRFNGGAERDPATMTDWIQFVAMPVPCSATADTTVGSTCSVETTLDTVVPGMIRESKRTIWQLGQIVVRDVGVDDPSVTAYSTLAIQAVFVP
jgi:hypothetical protein